MVNRVPAGVPVTLLSGARASSGLEGVRPRAGPQDSYDQAPPIVGCRMPEERSGRVQPIGGYGSAIRLIELLNPYTRDRAGRAMRATACRCDAEDMSAVIEVQHLHKRYGDTVAVGDVSFTVHEGEIFGILGPNGAGKTTTVECIEGLREPDGGEISVLGLDPLRDRAELTQRARGAAAGKPAARPAQGRRGAGTLQLLLPGPGRLAGTDGGARDLGQGQDPVPASSPAASSSGCPSPWRWSATRGWRCSTSSPPAWTRRPGGTPGT